MSLKTEIIRCKIQSTSQLSMSSGRTYLLLHRPQELLSNLLITHLRLHPHSVDLTIDSRRVGISKVSKILQILLLLLTGSASHLEPPFSRMIGLIFFSICLLDVYNQQMAHFQKNSSVRRRPS